MKRPSLALFLLLTASRVASGKDCDRACLTRLITTYVDAMVAHTPESLPLAANVRFTEDMKELRLGEGMTTWTRASDAPRRAASRAAQSTATFAAGDPSTPTTLSGGAIEDIRHGKAAALVHA